MTSIRPIITGICEQDLDLFFLEEMISDEPFRDWFVAQIPAWPKQFSSLVSARRSFSHADGELDLVFEFEDENGDHAHVLIENKVSAGLQPDQLLRYQEYARTVRQQVDCRHVAVVLVAPAAYVSAARVADAFVSYEDVANWLGDRRADPRMAYKEQLIRAAITRRGSGHNPEADAPVTEFWQAYWATAARFAPELEMARPAGKPPRSAFVWFGCTDLPGASRLCHKLVKGFVDLHLSADGGKSQQIAAALVPLLDSPMQIVRAGTPAVRLRVPRLTTSLSFAEQEGDAVQGIEAAQALRKWAITHATQLATVTQQYPAAPSRRSRRTREARG